MVPRASNVVWQGAQIELLGVECVQGMARRIICVALRAVSTKLRRVVVAWGMWIRLSGQMRAFANQLLTLQLCIRQVQREREGRVLIWLLQLCTSQRLLKTLQLPTLKSTLMQLLHPPPCMQYKLGLDLLWVGSVSYLPTSSPLGHLWSCSSL